MQWNCDIFAPFRFFLSKDAHLCNPAITKWASWNIDYIQIFSPAEVYKDLHEYLHWLNLPLVFQWVLLLVFWSKTSFTTAIFLLAVILTLYRFKSVIFLITSRSIWANRWCHISTALFLFRPSTMGIITLDAQFLLESCSLTMNRHSLFFLYRLNRSPGFSVYGRL